ESRAPAADADRKGLAAALKGDLDTIVLRALRESPAERYSTPGELARDIERYLKKEPILARPRAPWYRAGKFVRRNRSAVVAAPERSGADGGPPDPHWGWARDVGRTLRSSGDRAPRARKRSRRGDRARCPGRAQPRRTFRQRHGRGSARPCGVRAGPILLEQA